MNAKGEVVAYLVRINRLYDGSYDWNHRDTRRTSARLENCDKPKLAFQKLLNGEQALIPHSDIVTLRQG